MTWGSSRNIIHKDWAALSFLFLSLSNSGYYFISNLKTKKKSLLMRWLWTWGWSLLKLMSATVLRLFVSLIVFCSINIHKNGLNLRTFDLLTLNFACFNSHVFLQLFKSSQKKKTHKNEYIQVTFHLKIKEKKEETDFNSRRCTSYYFRQLSKMFTRIQ